MWQQFYFENKCNVNLLGFPNTLYFKIMSSFFVNVCQIKQLEASKGTEQREKGEHGNFIS